jgi:hypothetical protein
MNKQDVINHCIKNKIKLLVSFDSKYNGFGCEYLKFNFQNHIDCFLDDNYHHLTEKDIEKLFENGCVQTVTEELSQTYSFGINSFCE